MNDQLNANYVGNEIIYDTVVLESNLFYYNDVHILIRGDIVTIAHKIPNPVAFKVCAPFITCITKIDGIAIDDAEDLELVMPMYNLIEYSSYYSKMTGSLWLYSSDQSTNCNGNIPNNNNFKFFEYKSKLLVNTEAHTNNDSDNANSNSITFTIRVTKLYVPVVTLWPRTVKNHQKF